MAKNRSREGNVPGNTGSAGNSGKPKGPPRTPSNTMLVYRIEYVVPADKANVQAAIDALTETGGTVKIVSFKTRGPSQGETAPEAPAEPTGGETE